MGFGRKVEDRAEHDLKYIEKYIEKVYRKIKDIGKMVDVSRPAVSSGDITCSYSTIPHMLVLNDPAAYLKPPPNARFRVRLPAMTIRRGVTLYAC